MIGLQTIVSYIIIHLTHYNIRVYYFVIHIRSVLIKHPIHIRIRILSALHSYSTISVFASIFFLEMWKRIWEEHYPIRIRSVSTPSCDLVVTRNISITTYLQLWKSRLSCNPAWLNLDLKFAHHSRYLVAHCIFSFTKINNGYTAKKKKKKRRPHVRANSRPMTKKSLA
jgi:hypothetical protein